MVTRSALDGLALALALAGEPQRAGAVLGAAGAMGDGSGATWTRGPEDARSAAELVAAQIGEPAPAEAQERGRHLPLDELLNGL